MQILLLAKRHKTDPAGIDKALKEVGLFYAWQCVSLLTEKRTFDFIIPRREDLLCIVHALQTSLFQLKKKTGEEQEAQKFMTPLSVHKRNLIKMKISFEAFL